MSKNDDYKTQADIGIDALRSMIRNLIALPEEAKMEDKIEETLEDLEKLRAKVENHTKGYENKDKKGS